MNNERIVSTETKSMIYHKPGCRYVKRMKYQNKMSLTKHEARWQGGRVCRYCNSMNHHVRDEQADITFYENHRNMQFKFLDGILYVKTEIGCWKLVYSRKEEKIAIYHRNTTSKELDFENPQNEPYHRQEDKPYCNSISSCLNYIYEHDKYKATVERGEKVTKFSSKKYAKREAKAEKKRARRRVDYLFSMLESQNKGYRQLACW